MLVVGNLCLSKRITHTVKTKPNIQGLSRGTLSTNMNLCM
jgi:hypothetical protein